MADCYCYKDPTGFNNDSNNRHVKIIDNKTHFYDYVDFN